jgi:16S rRNA (guanine527-N7)-methyltransferase
VLLNQLNLYLSQAGIICTPLQKTQLIDYVMLLHQWNKAYNLTSVREPEQMLIRHIMDSAVISKYLGEGARYIDVGSGPGLPGMVLAILNPDKEFYLLDSLGKRIRFQVHVVTQLGLKNVYPVQSRVEDFLPEKKFDAVLSRAFASLKDMLLWCRHLTKDHGKFLALKGKLVQEEIKNLPIDFELKMVHSLQIPALDEERHLLEIEKKIDMEISGEQSNCGDQSEGRSR